MVGEAEYWDVMHLVRRASLLSDRIRERLFRDQIGVGRAVFLLLRTIDETPDGVVSQQSLADRLGLTKGAISRHVAAAQQEGWLTYIASPISRRENALVLTAEGQELVERGRTLRIDYDRRISEQLSDAEVSAAIRVLSVVCDFLEEEERR